MGQGRYTYTFSLLSGFLKNVWKRGENGSKFSPTSILLIETLLGHPSNTKNFTITPADVTDCKTYGL